MNERCYSHSKYFRLDFLPGLTFLVFMLIAIYILPSSDKVPGYAFVCVLIVYFWVLWIKGKRILAEKVVIDDKSIMAFGVFENKTNINWVDVKKLTYSGRGLFLIGWKLEKFLYAEVISIDEKKIVIRRDIPNFTSLLSDIEVKTGRSFVNP